MDSNTIENGESAAAVSPPPREKPRRRHHRRKIEPYAWLAAGAVGIGIATALSAPAVAHADDSSGGSTSASAPSHASADSGTAAKSPRVFGQRARAEHSTKSGAQDTDPDAEGVQQRKSSGTKRDSATTRARVRAAASQDSDADRHVSADRIERSVRQTAEREDSTPQVKADKIEKVVATAAADPAPAPAKRSPTKLSDILSGLFTRTKAVPVQSTTGGTQTAGTARLTAATQTTQSSTLQTLLSALFPRLRGTPAPAQTPTPPPVSTPGQSPAVPTKDDAGLTEPFQRPDAPTGRTLNVRDYGATSNRSSDNDAVAIQRAINAANPGDTVYIPNGTYHIKSTINLKSGVSLVGESRDNTVLAGAFWTAPHAMIYAAPGTTNLTISSFKITSASGPTYKAAIRLGSEGSNQVSRIAVQNMNIEKFERFGIQLQNAYHVLVEGNTVKNATALNGGGQGYGIIIDQSLSNNNWITNNEVGPVIRHAILIQFSANHNLIDHNTITGTVSGAIDLHGEDEYANEIAYNTISNGVRNGTTVSPNGAGIEVGEFSGTAGTTTAHDNSGPGNYIHNNTVYNYSMGMRVVNNSNYTFIEDNVFYNNLGAGIQADLAPLNNLYITGNQIYNNGAGVVLYDVTQAVVENNTIKDNRDAGLWTNAGTTSYLIEGNLISGSKADVTLLSTLGVYIPGLSASSQSTTSV